MRPLATVATAVNEGAHLVRVRRVRSSELLASQAEHISAYLRLRDSNPSLAELHYAASDVARDSWCALHCVESEI